MNHKYKSDTKQCCNYLFKNQTKKKYKIFISNPCTNCSMAQRQSEQKLHKRHNDKIVYYLDGETKYRYIYYDHSVPYDPNKDYTTTTTTTKAHQRIQCYSSQVK